MAEKQIGCARPSGRVGVKPETKTEATHTEQTKEKPMSKILVGRPAPDFTAPTFHKGEFGSVTLSDYLGKWVVLCFYPGDFTFV